VNDDAKHLLFRSGFAGPDFKLAGALVDEHLDTGDDGNVLFAGHAQQRRVDRVIDHIEDEARVDFFRFENVVRLYPVHADRRCVQNDVELRFSELFALEGFGLGLTR